MPGTLLNGRLPACCVFLLLLLAAAGCGFSPADRDRSGTVTVTTGRIKTLDPALADDVVSGLAVGHLYDRLLQYDYAARPYRLVPAMAAAMPEVGDGGLTVEFKLRDDLFFAPDACFADTAAVARRVQPRDVVWSLLRLADGRLHAGGYAILRGRLQGVDEFYRRTSTQAAGDFSAYEQGIPGLQAGPGNTVRFRLTAPYPQLLDVLAMPYASVLPEAAVRRYPVGVLAEHPVGSGPFLLEEWRRNYRFVLRRNPEFRHETVPWGVRPLPLPDRVCALVVQEPLTTWLLFLQGNVDMLPLGQDMVDSVLDGRGGLAPALAERGIRLHTLPEFQINYIGINARDPLLGRNLKLRQALSLAYNTPLRMQLSSGQLVPAQGPIPPGVPGYDAAFRNPHARYDVEKARALLAEAGFPGGVDPATGRPLKLRFDIAGTDVGKRQAAELMVRDMQVLGIEIEPCLNNAPRLFEKIKRGDVQLFRLNWVGDYPDAQNFLQLFYGPNAGGCNRAWYRNPEFDRLYEQAAVLPDGAERTQLYRRMEALLAADCPWIFESFPVANRLVHSWVNGYIPHHFAYDGWKYLAPDDAARKRWQAQPRSESLVPAGKK